MGINLTPAPKRLAESATHSGMTRTQAALAGVGGQGHPVSTGGQALADSAAARPNQTAYGTLQKKFGPSPINRDCRSRTNDSLAGSEPGANIAAARAHTSDDMHALGAAIMGECVISGSTKLPDSTSEN